MRVTAQITIENEVGDEIDVDVSGDYSPFRKGRFEKGGLQIDPDEEEMVEDIEAEFNGRKILLSRQDEEKAEQKLLERAREDRQYSRADIIAEDRADGRRDDDL